MGYVNRISKYLPDNEFQLSGRYIFAPNRVVTYQIVGICYLIGIFQASNVVVTYRIALSYNLVGRFYVSKITKYLRDDLF